MSMMAWQLSLQNATVPPTCTLQQEAGGVRSSVQDPCPAPAACPSPPGPRPHSLVQLDLPVALLRDRHPVQGPREARGIKAPEEQLSAQGGVRVPGGRRGREGFLPFHFPHCILY